MNENQCVNCGYFFPPESTYFTKDYARYISDKPLFIANWCSNCGKVTVYKQVKLIGLIKLQFIKPAQVMSLDEFGVSNYGKCKDYEIADAYAHLLKLIWYSILEQLTEKDSKDSLEKAFSIAIERFSPTVISDILWVLLQYPKIASPGRQVEEGYFCQHLISKWETTNMIEEWISRKSDHPNINQINNAFVDMCNQLQKK